MTFRAHLWQVARLFTAQENAGVAAIEFAIYAGWCFMMIVAATVDIGLLLFTTSELDAAVSAGAEYAVEHAPLVAQQPQHAEQQTSRTSSTMRSGRAGRSSTVNVNNSNDSSHCYCPTGTPGSWTWGSTVTCGSACTGGGVGGQFVTITASRSSFAVVFDIRLCRERHRLPQRLGRDRMTGTSIGANIRRQR